VVPVPTTTGIELATQMHMYAGTHRQTSLQIEISPVFLETPWEIHRNKLGRRSELSAGF
jgi:hypothetical protein